MELRSLELILLETNDHHYKGKDLLLYSKSAINNVILIV